MTEITRSPDIIAAEINSIKDQARGMLLSASVEIGRRLKEAKALVAFGEWAEWLEKNVEYSQRTATDLMALADGYGNANWQTFANLGYSQAVVLLGLPETAREEFVESHDMDDITVRELQEQVRELREQLDGKQGTMDSLVAEADERAQKADENAETYKTRLEDMAKVVLQLREENRTAAETIKAQIEEAKKDPKKVSELEKELAQAQKKIGAYDKDKATLEARIKEIESQPPEIMQVMPPEAEEELNELRRKVTQLPNEHVARFRVQFEALTTQFSDLVDTLDAMEEDRGRYAGAVKALLDKMAARLSTEVTNDHLQM